MVVLSYKTYKAKELYIKYEDRIEYYNDLEIKEQEGYKLINCIMWAETDGHVNAFYKKIEEI